MSVVGLDASGNAPDRPTHHVKLVRGSDEVNLILCDGRGNYDKSMPRIRRGNQGGALKTFEGQQQYDDQDPPFATGVLNDFSGGGGRSIGRMIKRATGTPGGPTRSGKGERY